MMETKQNNKLTGADAEYGYRFGCDGMMSLSDACDHLGRSRWTIGRLVERGVLRRGKDPQTQRVSICRRSIREYIASIQE